MEQFLNDTNLNLNEKPPEEFLKLLVAFNALPHTKRGRTFMEISGYPHYENVCSNILEFYFDTTAEHGLQDLLISAFLRMAGEESIIVDAISVTREDNTGNGRIDLVIEGESFIIAIENKIFHWLANDLDDYSNSIYLRSKGKQIVIKVVLGLTQIESEKIRSSGFVSYTYKQLWQEVCNLLGRYIANANPKWVTYLLDFMETTANLAGQNMELKPTDQFFIEHNDAIEIMLTEHKAFLGRLTQKITMLIDMMKETTEATELVKQPWLCNKDRLVLDFKSVCAIYEIAFDLVLTPAGWNLQLFGRGDPAYAYLLKLVNQPTLKEKLQSASLIKKRYYSAQIWDIQADLGEIRDALQGWILAVCMATKSLSDEGTIEMNSL